MKISHKLLVAIVIACLNISNVVNGFAIPENENDKNQNNETAIGVCER